MRGSAEHSKAKVLYFAIVALLGMCSLGLVWIWSDRLQAERSNASFDPVCGTNGGNLAQSEQSPPMRRSQGSVDAGPGSEELRKRSGLYAIQVERLDSKLKELEAKHSKFLASYDYDAKEFVEIALLGPTEEEIKAETEKIVDQAGFDADERHRGLRTALGLKAEEFRPPEGCVCRVLSVRLPHNRKSSEVLYCTIGITDLSDLRLVGGRIMVSPIILSDSGTARLGTVWRYGRIVDAQMPNKTE